MPFQSLISRRASIRNALSEHPVSMMSSPERRFRTAFAILDDSRRTIAVAPLRAESHRRVVPVERPQQRGDVAWVVLQVRVDRHDDGAAGALEAGIERRRLPAVRLEVKPAHLGVLGGQGVDRLGRAVPAPVVHQDDLEPPRGRPQDGEQLVDQRPQVLALVEDRGDDRNVDRRRCLAHATLDFAFRRLGLKGQNDRHLSNRRRKASSASV